MLRTAIVLNLCEESGVLSVAGVFVAECADMKTLRSYQSLASHPSWCAPDSGLVPSTSEFCQKRNLCTALTSSSFTC